MNQQLELLKKQPSAYGGELFKTRKGRGRPRPLDTRNTMHLVLRSTKAKGAWSFKKPEHEKAIRAIIAKFSRRHGVKIHSMANVGNHLHFQIKLGNRYMYRPFIRAITAAIAMAVTGASRWEPGKRTTDGAKIRFWDYRPFTRIVQSYRAFLNLRDYICINRFEGFGCDRGEARWLIREDGHRWVGDTG